MSLLAGLLSIVVLMGFTFILIYVSEYTHEYPMVIVGIMMFGDFLLASSWFAVGLEIGVDSESSFKRGIALAFMITSFSRALIFLVNGKKKGYL